jgi:hypothetical protein
MSRKEELQIARDWFRANLQKELLSQMDLSTLTLANSNFILEGLNLLQDDCVYHCQINDSPSYIVTVVAASRRQAPRYFLLAVKRGTLDVG